jgi:hypothetical protein
MKLTLNDGSVHEGATHHVCGGVLELRDAQGRIIKVTTVDHVKHLKTEQGETVDIHGDKKDLPIHNRPE